MEVHAHTHSDPAHGGTSRKKFTHYLWEFFMLFLAVSLGFLVENQREHLVEHQRAKVFATNLYEELKKDTASLNDIIEDNKTGIDKLDSLCLFMDERNIPTGRLYYYSSYTPWVNFFSSNNTTIEQLKSSGNLRIMGNEVSQKISEYSKRLSDLGTEYGLSRSEFEKMEALYFKIFDVHARYKVIPDRDKMNRDSVFKLNIPLANDDDKLIKEYIGWVQFEIHIYRLQNTRHLIPLKGFVIELMALLKKKYHLE